MSDVNLEFIVSNNNIDFTVAPNDITITPTDVQLTFFTGSLTGAGGGNTQLQYNNGGVLGGIPSANYVGGNLTFQIANTKITGGTNHYYLQTDGTGNLTWAVGTGNMQGNGTVAGANTQIQFNDGGNSFGGNAGFTFERPSGNVNIPGNLIVVGNIYGNIANAGNANYANYAGNAFSVDGINVSGAVAFATTANAVAGANVFGTVAYATNAAIATNAETVTTNAQPNITSLGTLTTLLINGTTSIQQVKEKVNANATGSTGTVNFDILTSAILLKTANATANFTINIRGNSTNTFNSIISNNESLTCTYINKNGAFGYYANSFTVDGTSQSIKWSTSGNGAPTAGTGTGYDAYTFNIIKTAANTYTIFGSRAGYQ
jgi:hypothetical protein